LGSLVDEDMGKVATLHTDAQRECSRDACAHDYAEILDRIEWRMRKQTIRIHECVR
jgi:hypothetical protein